MPEVAFKAPEVPKGYTKFDVDEYTVYVANSAIKGSSHINFTVRGWSVFKEVVAEGIRFPMI